MSTLLPRPDDLIPVRDAAQLAGRGISTIRTWVRMGKVDGWREDPDDDNSRLLVSRAAIVEVAAALGPSTRRGPGSAARWGDALQGSAPEPAPHLAAPPVEQGTEHPASTPDAGADPRVATAVALATAEARIEGLERLLTERAAQLAGARSELETSRAEALGLRERLQAAREDSAALRLSLARAEAQLEGGARVEGALQEQIAAAGSLAQVRAGQAEDLRAQLQDTQDRLQRAEAELTALRAQQGRRWWQKLLTAAEAPQGGEDR